VKSLLCLLLVLSCLPSTNSQEPQRVLSNSDIVNMSKSGIGERTTIWTGSMRATLQPTTGEASTVVVTPEFNYLISGKMTTLVPPAVLQDLLTSLRLDPMYIAKHRDEYSCVSDGTEQVGNVSTAKLKIVSAGVAGQFNADPSTGRLLRTTQNSSAGQTTIDYSDWRLVDGIYVPFKRHFASTTSTSDVSVSEYQVNPTIDSSWFQPIAGQVAASLTFKVLQAESVPYTVQTNGGISTNQRDTRRKIELVTNVLFSSSNFTDEQELNQTKPQTSDWQDFGEVLLRFAYVPNGVSVERDATRSVVN
jgi:hypothetical protein